MSDAIESKPKPKAVVLLSGGLDSALAVRYLQRQGVDVHAVFFSTGFCIQAQQKRKGSSEELDVVGVAENLGVELEAIDISREFIPIISNPRFGYGKNINPCIDCRIFMLQKARELMQKHGADFVATGEVLEQRPKSQKYNTQRLIEKESGLEGKLLRPLSARLLPETEAEKNHLLDRQLLGAIRGRSRKEQIRLAREWQVDEVATPGGGCCFLTDPTYAVRFKDLVRDRMELLQLEKEKSIGQDDVVLLGAGRHFKIRRGLKFICGRNQGDNRLLYFYRRSHIVILAPDEIPGPTGIVDIIAAGQGDSETRQIWGHQESAELARLEEFLLASGQSGVSAGELLLCARIQARYGDGRKNSSTEVELEAFDDAGHKLAALRITVSPFADEKLLAGRLLLPVNEQALFSWKP